MSGTTDDDQSNSLINAKQLADELGVRPSAVSNWRNGRSSTPFPRRAGGTDGRPLFKRSEVEAWLRETGKKDLGATIEQAGEAAAAFQRRLTELVPLRDQPRVLAAALVELAFAREADSGTGNEALIPHQLRSSLPGRDLEAGLMSASSNLEQWLDLRRPELADLAALPPEYRDRRQQIRSLVSTTGVSLGDLGDVLDFVTERARQVVRGATGWSTASAAIPDVVRRFVPAQASSVTDLTAGEGATLLAAASVAPGARFTAVDVDPEALRLARQRALLAGIKVAGAEGDALTVALQPVDVVIAEPTDKRTRAAEGSTGPEIVDVDLALALRAADLLTEDGIGLVFVSATTLDRPSAAKARRKLLGTGRLAAVLALPADRGRPLAVLVLRGRRSDTVLLGPFAAVEPADVVDGNRSANPDHTTRVLIEELLEAGAVLSPGRWVAASAERVPAKRVAQDIRVRLDAARGAMRDLRPAKVGRIASAEQPMVTVRELYEQQVLVPAVRATTVQLAASPTVLSARQLRNTAGRRLLPRLLEVDDERAVDQWSRVATPGDVVVWVEAGRVRAAVLHGQEQVLVTNRADVVRIQDRERLDPDYLGLVLSAQRAQRFVSAGVIGRFALRDVDLALPSLEDQRSAVSAVLRLEADGERLEEARALLRQAADSLQDALALGRIALDDPS